MANPEIADQLNEIVARHYRFKPVLTGLFPAAPFDYDKPNLHDTKAEFLAEVALLDRLLEHVLEALSAILPGYDEDDPDYTPARALIRTINRFGRNNAGTKKLERPVDLVVKNALSLGLCGTSLYLLLEWKECLLERKQELETVSVRGRGVISSALPV